MAGVFVNISMLLPARGRPKNLKMSIESVFDLAREPGAVELVVRLDDDDPHLEEELDILRVPAPGNVQVVVGPRLGYGGMAEMYNSCAAIAKGAFLCDWNDDMLIATRHYDALIMDAPAFCIQFPRLYERPTTDYTLPFTAKRVFETVGHLSQNAYCDAWLSDIAGYSGISVERNDIAFKHFRLNDATLKEQGISGGDEMARFKMPEQRAQRLSDIEAIVAAPEYNTRFLGWWSEERMHPAPEINGSRVHHARSYTLKGKII